MLDLPNWGAWEQAGDRVRSVLASQNSAFASPAIGIQVYQGYEHALTEITSSLALMFPHRKTMAYVLHSDATFEPIAVTLSKDGFTVKALTASDVGDPKPWIDPIQKDLLMVLAANDHPITAEHHSLAALGDALKTLRTFRINVIHFEHRSRAIQAPLPFQIKILSFRSDFAVVILGERAKLTPAVAPKLPVGRVSDQELSAFFTPIEAAQLKKNQQWISVIESQLPKGFIPLTQNSTRHWDRVGMTCEEFDGESVIDFLQQKWKTDGKPSIPTQEWASSTSLCRWKNSRLLDWYLSELAHLAPAISIEGGKDTSQLPPAVLNRLRGGCVFDAQTLTQIYAKPEEFLADLTHVAQRLREIQR